MRTTRLAAFAAMSFGALLLISTPSFAGGDHGRGGGMPNTPPPNCGCEKGGTVVGVSTGAMAENGMSVAKAGISGGSAVHVNANGLTTSGSMNGYSLATGQYAQGLTNGLTFAGWGDLSILQ